jgi:hypothetical protein
VSDVSRAKRVDKKQDGNPVLFFLFDAPHDRVTRRLDVDSLSKLGLALLNYPASLGFGDGYCTIPVEAPMPWGPAGTR